MGDMGELATALLVLFLTLWFAVRWSQRKREARTEPTAHRGTTSAKEVDR